jgi:tRNA threonylcarbamoyladenosine biosynthesis protein TsaE
MAVLKNTYHTKSADETKALGREFAGRLERGDSVGLIGDLGAGKTCLVQGVAEGLGIRGCIKSPSFTMVNVYKGGEKGPLFHMDLYRIEKAAHLDGLGLEEYICSDGVSVIEWAERSPALMPELKYVIRITSGGESERDIEIEERA